MMCLEYCPSYSRQMESQIGLKTSQVVRLIAEVVIDLLNKFKRSNKSL